MDNQCAAIIDEIKRNIEKMNIAALKAYHTYYNLCDGSYSDACCEILAMIEVVQKEWSVKK